MEQIKMENLKTENEKIEGDFFNFNEMELMNDRITRLEKIVNRAIEHFIKDNKAMIKNYEKNLIMLSKKNGE